MQTIKGTNVELILAWILAMEQDIKNNKFYYVEDAGRLGVNSYNKARLSIMYSIFHVSNMDYSKSQWDGFRVHVAEDTIQEGHDEMKLYFQVIKSLINIT